MKNVAVVVVLLAGLTFLGGCDALISALGPSQTTVRLVNDGDYDVIVELYYHDDQNVLEALISEVGTERNITVPPGETRSFSVACEDLQAIFIEDAELSLINEIGPDQQSEEVRRDGDDFNCGDTIIFTFTHAVTLTSLNIAFDTESSSPF